MRSPLYRGCNSKYEGFDLRIHRRQKQACRGQFSARARRRGGIRATDVRVEPDVIEAGAKLLGVGDGD